MDTGYHISFFDMYWKDYFILDYKIMKSSVTPQELYHSVKEEN